MGFFTERCPNCGKPLRNSRFLQLVRVPVCNRLEHMRQVGASVGSISQFC